ncbi:MAG: ABC transporter permease subunit, partial [Lentisphaeria bacterium]
AQSMNIPFWTTFRRITLPITLPAIIEIAIYFFASTMATVSAVIFLYTPNTMPATVAIVNLNDAGESAPAMALCIAIIAINIIAKIIAEISTKIIKKFQKYNQLSN